MQIREEGCSSIRRKHCGLDAGKGKGSTSRGHGDIIISSIPTSIFHWENKIFEFHKINAEGALGQGLESAERCIDLICSCWYFHRGKSKENTESEDGTTYFCEKLKPECSTKQWNAVIALCGLGGETLMQTELAPVISSVFFLLFWLTVSIA